MNILNNYYGLVPKSSANKVIIITTRILTSDKQVKKDVNSCLLLVGY